MPSLALSRQFFGVHSLAADPVALVEQEEQDQWAVTFRLNDVAYYWRCHVARSEEGLAAVWSEAVEHARTYLSLSSDRLLPEDIESRLGIEPTRSRRIGDPLPGRGRAAVSNWFALDAPAPEAGGFDRQMRALLDILERHETAVSAVVEACGGGHIQVAYTAWQAQMRGVGLKTGQAALLGRLELALDVDVYAQGPILTEE